MESADIFARAPVRIEAVVDTYRADGQLVAQSQSHCITHVMETSGNTGERIVRARQKIAGIKEGRAQQLAVKRESVFDIEDREELAADRVAAIVRTEVALGKAAHGRAAAVEKSFVDRDGRGRIVATQAVDDAGPRAQCQQCAPVHLAGLRRGAERKKISEPRRAADEIDVAPERGGGEVGGAIENETATRVHFAIAEIERLGKTDRGNEVRGASKKLRIDIGARHFDVPRAQDKTDLVLLRDLASEIKAKAGLEFGIAIEIERQRGELRLEAKLGVEEIRIFPEDLPFVTALRPFRQCRERAAVAEEIAIAIARADDGARVRAVTKREPELLTLRFLRGDVETERITVNRRRFDLENVE